MHTRATENETYVALTTKDISTTKDNNYDWGVMGLGYQPGNACIISNYRIKNKENFYKVVLHEMGHTTGLPHCADKTCFMADAEGHDATVNEKSFCKKCASHLRDKGWKT